MISYGPRRAPFSRTILSIRVATTQRDSCLFPIPQAPPWAGTTSGGQAGDAEGRRSALARTRHEIRLPADRAAAVRELAVTTEVEIGTRDARVSVGVLDEVSGLAGYATAQAMCAAAAPVR